MGLDNIPKHYPCKTKQTAVMVERRNRDGEPLRNDDGTTMMVVDCKATQDCGGCPYKNAYEAAGSPAGQAYGMLGTDCWYRGKYGNYLMEALAGEYLSDDLSFFGDNEDGTEKSVASCVSTADYIDDLLMEHSDSMGRVMVEGNDIAPDVRYASWWLRWVAEECDGAVCWY